MRKAFYAMFLLGTTAMWPQEAHSMPVVLPFIGGLLTAIGAPAIGGTIAGLAGFSAGAFAAGYGFAGSLLGGILIKTALSLGLSYLASLLRPHADTPNPGAKLVNVRQPISFMQFGYGLVRVGGPVNFWQALNGRRYYDVIYFAHECDGTEAYFADENEVTLDGSGFVIEASYQARVRILDYNGAAGQVADPVLMAAFPTQWTATHNMEGLSHAVVVAQNTSSEDFSKVYPTGREPVITELKRTKKVYDPRNGLTAYSTNAALIIADWVTSADGLGRTVNWDKVATEANACDVNVVDRDSNVLKKWTLSGTYSGSDDRETVRAQMGVACDAFFYEDVDGIVGFNVGRYIDPTVTITDNDIIRVQYSEGQQGTDIANAQSVQYTEPEQGYREAASSPYIVTDATEAYSEDSLSVFWISNHNQAVRVSKRLLVNSRAQYRAQFVLKYSGIRLIAQRFFWLDHVEMGLSTAMEVDKLSRNDDGLTWTIEAHSVSASDFDFDATTEEPAKPKRTAFTVSQTVPEPTSITAVVQPYFGSISILVDWDDPPRDSLLNQVRYRVHSPAGAWFQLSVPAKQSYQRIVGIDDGQTYDVQVRAITSTGLASKWVPNSGGDETIPTLAVGVLLDAVAPVALVSFNATGSVTGFTATFGTASDTHLYAVKIYKVPNTVTLNKATHLVGTYAVTGGLSYSLPFLTTGGLYDIYAEPINRSSIAGPLSGPISAVRIGFFDNFNRANSNLEATIWTRLSGTAATFTIVSNQVAQPGANTDTQYLSTDITLADSYVQAKIVALTSVVTGPFVTLRVLDVNNFIGFRVDSGNINLFKRVAGTFTLISSSAYAVNDVFRLEANGTTLRVLKNGTLVAGPFTESSFSTQTRAGLQTRGVASPFIDDFENGPL